MNNSRTIFLFGLKPNKKIVLELFACMLVIHQNDALLRNMAIVKHCHNFQHLHWYTFKGEGGVTKGVRL